MLAERTFLWREAVVTLVVLLFVIQALSAGAEDQKASQSLEESAAGFLAKAKIDRRPSPQNYGRGKLEVMPKYAADSQNPFEVDLRSYDLSGLDLKGSAGSLFFASFDDKTAWPVAERMPDGFDPKEIMELGKNPGLGVRSLHEKGITGRGVSIAIVDQTLLTEHNEYADRLGLYEEMDIGGARTAQMHGAAVASIAVGKTVGVAPQAELYYVASRSADFGPTVSRNFTYFARAVERILEINAQLPADRKIRVISLSIGWGKGEKGYKEITTAAQKAKSAGMLVICSSVEQVHGFAFQALGRHPMSNPDEFTSYGPGLFWASAVESMGSGNRLLVPMDSRTTASQTGTDDYVFYRQGGWSWSIPYVAGTYALVCQVRADITPERFWALAMKTGRTIQLSHKGENIPFGRILDPAKLIEAIKSDDLTNEDAIKAELATYRRDRTRQRPRRINNSVAGKLGKKPDPGFAAKLQERIDQLDIWNDSPEDIIRVFGEPLGYTDWAGDLERLIEKDKLPKIYYMHYPSGFRVLARGERIVWLIFDQGGCTYWGISIGSSLDDVLSKLGQPKEVVKGQSLSTLRSGVLYTEIPFREEGTVVYHRPDLGITVTFEHEIVSSFTRSRAQPTAPGI